MSPRGLFEIKGIPYSSYFVAFEDVYGVKINSQIFKNNALNELKEILGRTEFSILDEDIVDIVISVPE